MSIYRYELPTTGAVSFADICTGPTAYSAPISDTTQARANLRGALKEAKRAGHGDKDYLRLVKILDEYLPQVRGIMAAVAAGEIDLKSEPVFSWRTTLSASIFHASPRLSLPTLHADLAFSLLTYAFVLSNLARSVVTALGDYEHERGISDVERKAKDEKLNFAVTLLCKASGVFSYISDTVLSDWRSNMMGDGGVPVHLPPDLNQEVNTALAKMALADAQSLAIRKLLSKSAYDSTVAPGPPLPSSHPSPALLAKLHLECALLYSSARALAKTSAGSKAKGKAPSSSATDGDVAPDLRRYLSDEAAFHNALARKWLGVDAGENGGSSKGGVAVGFLAWAKKELEELKDGGRGLGLGRDKEQHDRRKEKVAAEMGAVAAFWQFYKKINDSLTFNAVPSQTDLQASIPAGRQAVAARPFPPLVPAFGPGSVGHTHWQAEERADGTGPPMAAGPRLGRSYAGEGSYF